MYIICMSFYHMTYDMEYSEKAHYAVSGNSVKAQKNNDMEGTAWNN